jgi:hypothetical protein
MTPGTARTAKHIPDTIRDPLGFSDLRLMDMTNTLVPRRLCLEASLAAVEKKSTSIRPHRLINPRTRADHPYSASPVRLPAHQMETLALPMVALSDPTTLEKALLGLVSLGETNQDSTLERDLLVALASSPLAVGGSTVQDPLLRPTTDCPMETSSQVEGATGTGIPAQCVQTDLIQDPLPTRSSLPALESRVRWE